jgi:hypothetical protein
MKERNDSHPKQLAGLPTGLLKALVFAAILAVIASTQLPAQSPAQSPVQSVARSSGRINITARSGSRTIYAGTSIELDVELQDTRGQPIAAAQDQTMVITVTTLESLDSARKKLAAERAQPPPLPRPLSLAGRVITLASGKEAVQVSGIFPRSQKKITLRVIPRVAGKIRVFAEYGNFLPGNLLIPALPVRKAQLDRREPLNRIVLSPALVPASQPPQPNVEMYLELEDSGLDPIIDEQGDLIARFDVTLNANGFPFAAPEDLTVALRVVKGRAGFDAREVTIKRGRAANTPQETARLRSRTGGEVELQAVVLAPSTLGIKPDQRLYVFMIDKAAKRLQVAPSSPTAMANGLDAITLTVTAFDKDDRIIRAEHEGLGERTVSFRLDAGIGFSFTDNNPQLRIPKDQDSGSITLVARRPVTDLKVFAESRSGWGDIVKGDAVVSYVLPLWQLLWAILGGVTLPLLGMLIVKKSKPLISQRTQHVLFGALWGFLLFVLAFFGALGFSTLNFSGLPVLVTKLPTESSIAAYLLGMLGGGLPLGYSAFKRRGAGGANGDAV